MATTNEQMNNLLSPDDMMLEGMEEGTFDQAKKDTAEFAKSVARGSITSPITAAADVVDTGKMLPTLDEQVKPFFPMYSSIEGAFEELSNLGISRENAVDLIRKATNNKIDLKGDTGEFVGEFISPAAATKAAGAIATSAAKYGPKAVDSVSRIAGEAKKLFSDAGGFDDLAMATAGSPSAQTAKMLDSPELPDTSITKIIIGSSGKDYEKKSKAYESAKKELSPFGSNNAPVSDSEAQELWNRTGAQEDLVDNDIVYEIPTVNAKLKLTNPKSRYADSPFDYNAGRVTYNPQVKTTLSDILDFDELFEQAPYLKDIEVKKVSGIQRLFGTKAGYNPVDNTIYIADGTPKELTSDLLHEVEHAVQNADGKRFDGGNFNRIMKEDPEYKKLGGDAGINKLNQLKRDILDDYAPMLPGNLEAGTRRETVRNFLDTYGTLPDPDKFIKEVKKLSTNKDSKHGGGTFSYLSDLQEWVEENFPDVEYEYPSKIGDTIAYIKTASEKDLKDIIKDYRKNNLEGLEKYKKIKERAVLKYMRDPGEVTARNVQFRFKLSQIDPGITRVAPRFTEDKAARPLEVPVVDETKIRERGADSDALRDKARELGVELSDDNVLPIAEGQRYYLASKAEQGGDTAQVLQQSIIDFGDAKRDKELKGALSDIRTGMSGIMQNANEAFDMFAARGDMDKLVPGTKILSIGNKKGQKKPLTVEGYSVTTQPDWSLKRYKELHKDLIAKGLIPEEPVTIPYKGKNYRLMVHLKDADGNVERHHADMVTYKPEIFTQPRIVESLAEQTEDAFTEFATPLRTTGRGPEKKLVAKDKPIMRVQESIEESLSPRMKRAMDVENFPEAASILPAPGRFFDPARRDYKEGMAKGLAKAGIELDLEFGNYIMMGKGKPTDVSNETFENLFISPRTSFKRSQGTNTSTARANQFAENLSIEDMKKNYKQNTGKEGKEINTNLLQPERFKVISNNEERLLDHPIIAVQPKSGKHYYTLDTQFVGPVNMKRMTDKVRRKLKSGEIKEEVPQPNLRPATVGDVRLGNVVGEIKVGSKTHSLYDYIEVDAVPSFSKGKSNIEKFKQGGAVPMNTMSRQMELFEPVERGFEEGGLMDEGGTIDPVSGNDVPPGSTQEEVRDDIPAQLSEGEFVFPADVVRYIGLEKLMRMRQEAKMGLAAMEAMGQMGNSEEAIMPDDLPFDMYDLEVEDDTLEMQTGGVVPSTSQLYNIPSVAPMYGASNMYSLTGQPASTMPTPIQPITTPVTPTGMAPSPVTAASAAPYTTGQVGPNLRGTAFTPTAITPVTPTFQETIGAGVVGVDYEFVEFTNEAGQTIRLRRNKTTGEMIDPIPEGFYERVREEEQVETTPTTDVGTQTTRVAEDDGGREKDGDMSGATTAFGGSLDSKGRVSGGFKADISFGGVNIGGIKGTMAGLAKSGFGQLKGQPSSFSLQPGQTATITNVQRIRPAGVYSGKPDTYSAQLQFDAETYNDLFTNKGVTSRKDMEAIMEDIISTYGEDFLNDPDNVVNVGLVRDTMSLREARQAQKDFVEAAQNADDTIRDEDGNTARDRAFGVKDETSSTGYTEGSVIDKAIKEAEADQAKEDKSGDQGDRSDSAPDRGMSGQGDVGFGSGTDCLTENMKVKLNGVIDFVTNIKVGDIIDGSVVKEVLHKHMRSGYFVINNELEITNDHPVLANGAWTKPEELYIGDYINDVKVESIKYIDRMTPTVSIVIDGDSFDVYTEGNTYTVHGRYREVRQEAA